MPLVDADVRNRFQLILEASLQTHGLAALIASTKDADELPSYKKMILRASVADEFRRVINSTRAKYLRRLTEHNMRIYEYDPSSKPDDHEIEHIDLTHQNAESIRAQVQSLGDLGGIEDFRIDQAFTDGMRFYVISVPLGDLGDSYWFRSYRSSKELNRSAAWGLLFREDHFDVIRDPVFLFDDHIDCAIVGSDLFVFKKFGFQKMFQYFERVHRAATSTLEAVARRIPISGFDELKSACLSHLQMTAKLMNISRKPYLENITFDDIRTIIADHGLHVEIVNEGGIEKIKYESENKWEILRLLDDDYLNSKLTNLNYEVNSKRRTGT